MMKKLLLLLCISCLSFAAQAQSPWTPIHPDKVYNYYECLSYKQWGLTLQSTSSNDSIDLCYQSVYIDSFQMAVVGTDSIWHLNKVLGKEDTIKDCILSWYFTKSYLFYEGKSQFLQAAMHKKANGDFHFHSPDTFVLVVDAALNDSWTFRNGASPLTATVIALDTALLFGTLDSVKTILLSNNDTIRLSRNWGIIQFPDFEIPGNYKQLHGIQKDTNTVGVRIPDFWDFYNYEVGDEFMYEYNYGSRFTFSNCYYKYNILSKEVLPTGYKYVRAYYSLCYPRNFGVDTVVFNHYDVNNCYICNNYYNTLPSHLANNHNFELTYITSFEKALTLVLVDTNGQLYKHVRIGQFSATDSCLNARDANIFKIGLGKTYASSSTDDDSRIHTLIGSIKNGVQTGTVYSDSMMMRLLSTEELETKLASNFAKLAPNPSKNGQTKILLSESLIEPLNIELYNNLGQLIWQQRLTDNELQVELNLPQLPAALYLLHLRSGNKQQVLKWLVLD